MAYFGGNHTGGLWQNVVVKILVLGCFFSLSSALLLYLVSGRDPQVITEVVVKEVQVEAEPMAQPVLAMVDVLVARDTIWAGQKLSPSHFEIQPRVVQGMEKSVITDTSKLDHLYASVNILAGATLVADLVTPSAPKGGVTGRIPPGYRAVTIAVDAESAVEGWVRPGAKVDVVWATNHLDRQVITTIVENAMVLSAARSTDVSSKDAVLPSHVTLLVPNRDAQRIQLARTSGFLSLNLRGDDDDHTVGRESLTISSLFSRRDILTSNEIEGSVWMGGREYYYMGGRLVPADAVEADRR